MEERWVSVNVGLPTVWSTYHNCKEYLCYMGGGFYILTSYADGWNCRLNDDGTIYRECEFTGVKYWMELPEPPLEDIFEDVDEFEEDPDLEEEYD